MLRDVESLVNLPVYPHPRYPPKNKALNKGLMIRWFSDTKAENMPKMKPLFLSAVLGCPRKLVTVSKWVITLVYSIYK